jgi:hypothetical protein
MPRILAHYRMHAGQKTKRLAALAAYRQRQLREQLFAGMFPNVDAGERATFARVAGNDPLARDELLAIADLFVCRLRSPDPEARQRVLLHWRRLTAQRAEKGLRQALGRHLDDAFLA